MPAKILVVDDDPALVNLLKESLEGDGYDVDEAYDGLGALARAQEIRPDAMIMDVNMPGLDGMETITRLRQNPVTALLPVILLTGESAHNLSLPPGDSRLFCLEKPVDFEALSSRLKNLFNGK